MRPSNSLRLGTIGALAAIVSLAAVPESPAETVKCQRTIAKEMSKYVKARVKTLQKCEEGKVKGKHSDPCPDPAGLPGTVGLKAAEKLAKAESKLGAKIGKACGGDDKVCGGDLTDEDTGAALGFVGTCPDFERQGCDNAISATSCAGIAACLECIGTAAADQAVTLYYGDLIATDPVAQKPLNKCQQTIGKETAKFLLAKEKTILKCWDAILKGQGPGSGNDKVGSTECPDIGGTPGLAAEKAALKIAKAESKKVAKICKACGGPSKTCDADIDTSVIVPGGVVVAGDPGPADDESVAAIGFAAACPAVTLPLAPGTDCGTLDDGGTPDVVDSLRELILCVDCVTQFKVECIDRTRVPDGAPTNAPVPVACNVGCGDDIKQADEDCDGIDDAACVGACAPPSLGADGCTCPTGTFTFDTTAGADLDAGWTGIAHDQEALVGRIFEADTYGCSGAGPDVTCSFVARYATAFFGPPLPLSSGAVPVCVVNENVGSTTGTLNLSTGAFAYDYALTSKVHTGLTIDQPCPICEGDPGLDDDVKAGTCNAQGGPSEGLACDADATSAVFGATSFDCLPNPAANVGNLSIVFDDATTGTKTVATSAASPNCSAAGFTNDKCLCDTCDNVAGTPCRSDADCVAVGATSCGGPRCRGGANNGTPCTASSDCLGEPCSPAGTATAPHACSGGNPNCTAGGGLNEGQCPTGPFDPLCRPTETFRGCSFDSDCPFPGDTCQFGFRECFLDPIVREGVPGLPLGAYAGEFCIPPTSASSVNDVAGLPGQGTLLLPYSITTSVP